MSIQTELTRITNAKAAIKTAIEGKGVTVPDGTMLDGMASLIESIETGGGIPGFKMMSGTYTPTENMTSNVDVYVSSTITASSSKISNIEKSLASFAFVAKTSLGYEIQYPTSFCNCYVFDNQLAINKASSSNSSKNDIGFTHTYYKTGTNKYVIKVKLVCNSTYPLVAGQTYAWMLIFPDDISL